MSYPLRRPVYMFTVYHRICGHVLGITNSRASALQLLDALPVRIRHGTRIRAGATDTEIMAVMTGTRCSTCDVAKAAAEAQPEEETQPL